jgi:hypothetical protein
MNEINQKKTLIQFLTNVSTLKENAYTRALFLHYWLEDINFHNVNTQVFNEINLEDMNNFYSANNYNYYMNQQQLEDKIYTLVSAFSSLFNWQVNYKDFQIESEEQLAKELVNIYYSLPVLEN